MAMKKWEELNVIDNALLNALAADEKIAKPFFRRLLSVLLEREIGDITVTGESIIPGNKDGLRGVRLDVEIEEKEAGSEYITNVYDVEPHLQRDLNFPRMLRFRQARIDSKHMKSGDNDFEHLPDLYILYITNFDIFGEGRMIYSFRQTCRENPKIEYDDGLQLLYFNTKGNIGARDVIRNVLHYIENSSAEAAVDNATKELDAYVTDVKHNDERRDGYMTVGDWIDNEVRVETQSLREEIEQKDAQIEQSRKQIEQKDALIVELQGRLAAAGL